MTSRISISEDNMKKLAKVRQGFETPDDCLQRILKNHCVKRNQKQNDVVEEGQ